MIYAKDYKNIIAKRINLPNMGYYGSLFIMRHIVIEMMRGAEKNT